MNRITFFAGRESMVRYLSASGVSRERLISTNMLLPRNEDLRK